MEKVSFCKFILLFACQKFLYVSAAEAILDESLDVINEDLFVYDFKQFSNVKKGSQNENEMDFHLTLKENGKSELLLHPVMELFLHMKWQLRNASMITNLAMNLLFVIFLSLLSQKYLGLTTCEPIPDNETCFLGPDGIKICDSIMHCHKKSIRTAEERPYTLEPICDAINKVSSQFNR